MTLQVTQSTSVGTATALSALTPAAIDTVNASSFGPTGLMCVITTTGTATTLTVNDPGRTPLGNVGTLASVTCGATAVTGTTIPLSAIDQSAQLATLNFSGARTGVTYTLVRI
jgi:hypothetical protein